MGTVNPQTYPPNLQIVSPLFPNILIRSAMFLIMALSAITYPHYIPLIFPKLKVVSLMIQGGAPSITGRFTNVNHSQNNNKP